MNDRDKEAFEKFMGENLPFSYYEYYSCPDIDAWQAACEYKQKELDEMKKVIEYYANPESWDFEEIDESDVEFCEDVQADLGGKRARDFLLKLEGKCKIIE